jgi:uncharacterized protein
MIAHASAFVQLLGIPSVLGPLVIWLIRGDDPTVEPHARAALNFQMSLLIYFLIGWLVAFVAFVTIIGIGVAFLIVAALIGLFILELVFALIATLAASRGEFYNYPMSLQLIKG